MRVKTLVERLQPILHVVLGQQLQPATRRARERMSAFDAGAQTCLALRMFSSELLHLQISLLTLDRSTLVLQLQRCTQRLHAHPQPHHHGNIIVLQFARAKIFPQFVRDMLFTTLFRFKILNNPTAWGCDSCEGAACAAAAAADA